jgi:hypothetical protein
MSGSASPGNAGMRDRLSHNALVKWTGPCRSRSERFATTRPRFLDRERWSMFPPDPDIQDRLPQARADGVHGTGASLIEDNLAHRPTMPTARRSTPSQCSAVSRRMDCHQLSILVAHAVRRSPTPRRQLIARYAISERDPLRFDSTAARSTSSASHPPRQEQLAADAQAWVVHADPARTGRPAALNARAPPIVKWVGDHHPLRRLWTPEPRRRRATDA